MTRRSLILAPVAALVARKANASQGTLIYQATSKRRDPFRLVRSAILPLEWDFDFLNKNGQTIKRTSNGILLTHEARSIMSQPVQDAYTGHGSFKFFERRRTFEGNVAANYQDLFQKYIDNRPYVLPALIEAGAYLLGKAAVNELVNPWFGLAADVVAAYSIIEKFMEERRSVDEATKVLLGLKLRPKDAFVVTSLEVDRSSLDYVHEVISFQAAPGKGAPSATLWTCTYKLA